MPPVEEALRIEPGPAVEDGAGAPHPSRRERRLAIAETALMVAALHGYTLFFRPSLAIDLVAILVAVAVVTALFRRRGETARSLGIAARRQAFARAAQRLFPVAAIAVVGSIAVRAGHGPLRPQPLDAASLAIAVSTYPFWGGLQQLFYLGFVLRGLVRGGVPRRVATGVTIALFALVHAPNWPLVLATFALELVVAPVYRRAPSLAAIGIVHGIAGSFAHEVMGLDLEVGARFWLPHR